MVRHPSSTSLNWSYKMSLAKIKCIWRGFPFQNLLELTFIAIVDECGGPAQQSHFGTKNGSGVASTYLDCFFHQNMSTFPSSMFLSIECSFKCTTRSNEFCSFLALASLFEYCQVWRLRRQTSSKHFISIQICTFHPALVAEDKPNGGKNTLGIRLAAWMDISPALECPHNTENPYYLKAITKSDPNK